MPKKTEKQLVREELGTFYDSDFDGTIGDLITRLESYGKDSFIEATEEKDYYSINTVFRIYRNRLETDKEYSKRIKRENKTKILTKIRADKLKEKEVALAKKLLKKHNIEIGEPNA